MNTPPDPPPAFPRLSPLLGSAIFRWTVGIGLVALFAAWTTVDAVTHHDQAPRTGEAIVGATLSLILVLVLLGMLLRIAFPPLTTGRTLIHEIRRSNPEFATTYTHYKKMAKTRARDGRPLDSKERAQVYGEIMTPYLAKARYSSLLSIARLSLLIVGLVGAATLLLHDLLVIMDHEVLATLHAGSDADMTAYVSFTTLTLLGSGILPAGWLGVAFQLGLYAVGLFVLLGVFTLHTQNLQRHVVAVEVAVQRHVDSM